MVVITLILSSLDHSGLHALMRQMNADVQQAGSRHASPDEKTDANRFASVSFERPV
jgi:hypothetical protein